MKDKELQVLSFEPFLFPNQHSNKSAPPKCACHEPRWRHGATEINKTLWNNTQKSTTEKRGFIFWMLIYSIDSALWQRQSFRLFSKCMCIFLIVVTCVENHETFHWWKVWKLKSNRPDKVKTTMKKNRRPPPLTLSLQSLEARAPIPE